MFIKHIHKIRNKTAVAKRNVPSCNDPPAHLIEQALSKNGDSPACQGQLY